MDRFSTRLAPIATLGALLLMGAAAAAAPINTDRPTAGESSGTVGWTTFQVELGPDVTMDEDAGSSTRSLRTPLELRYGMSEASEIHLQTAGFASESVTADGTTTDTNGYADLELGLKTNFFGGAGVMGIPATGLSVTFTLPVGSNAFRSRTFVPRVALLLDWFLPLQAVLQSNIGITFNNEADPRGFGSAEIPIFYSAALGRRIVGPVTGFVELFGEVPATNRGVARSLVDGGLLIHLGEDVQLDAAFRAGLSASAPDYGVTVGFSYRHQWGRGY